MTEAAGAAAPDAATDAHPPATAERGERAHRAVGVAVVALMALQSLIAFTYAAAMPTWRAPDEPSHFDMVLVAREGVGWPTAPAERRLQRRIEASYAPARFVPAERADEPPLAQADAVPRPQRATFAELADDVADGAGNGMFQHPPGYYATAAVAFSATAALVPGSQAWSYDQVVLAVRAVGAAAVALMPWLAFAAARRLGVSAPTALAAAVVPVAVPQLAHVGGAVSNDGLLAVVVGALTVVSLRLAGGDLRARTGVAIGAIAGAGLLIKGFALFAPALVGPAAVVGGWRAHRAGQPASVRRVVASLGVSGGLAAAIGGWWWLRNLVIHGTVQPTGMVVPEAPAGFEPSLTAWLGDAAVALTSTFWGQFGWRQADLPTTAVLAGTAVVVVGLAAAWWRTGAHTARDGRGSPPGRAEAVLALVPVVAITGIVLVGSWGYHVATSLMPALQGRYLLGGLVGVAAVAASGWARLAARTDRVAAWLPAAALVGAIALHLTAGWTILARFYGPADGGSLTDRLAAFVTWSPLPRPALAGLAVALLTAAAVAATALGVVAGRAGRHAGPVPAPR